MTDSSEIGRFGTLRLLKRHEPEKTIAFFPVDDEEVTFGRSKQCSVRLYYDCVSELHCTIQISEERKAFLLVQGTNGLLVDGCQVNPSNSPGSGPTTVPLTNGSEIEIYRKRFKFEYPPKEIRAILLATPRHAKPRRSLRMSMIRSAQVFSPRSGPANPPRTPQRGSIRDNVEWEALKSPVRIPSQENGSREMMLLEGAGDDAVVVEEEKDLIILEQVENKPWEPEAAISPSKQTSKPGRSVAFSIPTTTPPPRSILVPQSARGRQNAAQTPSLPRRRSAPSLHRAVVLRSAQLVQLERERERYTEEQEEDEVELAVSPERELGPFELNGDDDEEEEEGGDEDGESDSPVVPSNAASQSSEKRPSVLRAGFDVVKKVLPLPFGWKGPEDVPHDEVDEDEEGERQYDEDDDFDEDTAQAHTPVRRNLGPFMTPQVWVNRPAQRVPIDVKARASIGGDGVPQRIFGGAQRVRTVPPWKLQDIVLSEPEKPDVEEKQEIKNRVTDEERQAIMARRKSALQTTTPLPRPGPRDSAFPPPRRSDVYTPGEDSDEDAETMLEKMRQKMAHVRRKSEARKMRLSMASPYKTQEFSLLAARAERIPIAMGIVEETLSQTKRAEQDGGDEFPAPPLDTRAARDDLNMLHSTSEDESNTRTLTRVPSEPPTSSLTPRFDGVREMFRQPRLEPKTPSFTGFTKMFQDRSDIPAKTPSFRGVKQMFAKPALNPSPATPQLNLGDMFGDEDDNETENVGNGPEDEQHRDSDGTSDDSVILPDNQVPDAATTIKAEAGLTVAPASLPRSSTRSRKVTSSTKQSPKRKDIADLDTPPPVPEDVADEDDAEYEEVAHEVEPTPPAARRVTKRTAKKTTSLIATEISESSGRGASRSTRKAAATGQDIVVHKKSKARRVVNKDSDDEAKPDQVGSGGCQRVAKNQQVAYDQGTIDYEVVEVEISRDTGVLEVAAGETETVPVAKARRRRAAKTPQQHLDHGDVIPTVGRGARGIKTETPPDTGVPAPAAKSKRATKAKVTEIADEESHQVSPGEVEGQSEGSEEITPAPRRGKAAKRGATRKTPAPKDDLHDDKENAEEHPSKPLGKTPAVKGRRTPVTVSSAEVLDAPAKRTRSKK